MTPRRDAARLFAERCLSPDEVRTYVDTPISPAEREEVLALVRWFTRRYPTAGERLAYVRRAYLRWRNSTSRESLDAP